MGNVLSFVEESDKLWLKKSYLRGYQYAAQQGYEDYLYDEDFIMTIKPDNRELSKKMITEWMRGYADNVNGIYAPHGYNTTTKGEKTMTNYINELSVMDESNLSNEEDQTLRKAVMNYKEVKDVLSEEREKCIGCQVLHHLYDTSYKVSLEHEQSDEQNSCSLNGCAETISCIDAFAKDAYKELLQYAREKERGE